MISDDAIAQAVAAFWSGRTRGTQAAVHDRAFLQLIAEDLRTRGYAPHVARGISDHAARVGGYFRASKSWDIVCRDGEGQLSVAIEFKSQVDSYGNNENNRYEEALGSGLDARARYGHAVLLGFVLVLCDEEATTRPTTMVHDEISPEFRQTSHVDRRALFARRLTQFKLNQMPFYDAAAILLVSRDGGHRHLSDPALDLRTFVDRLLHRP
jgi:type II restriction enzyme